MASALGVKAQNERSAALLVVPAAIVLAGTVAQLVPGAPTALEYTRVAVEAGQWWRLVTGNFVHFGWGHVAGDLSAFVVLCWIARCRGRHMLRVVIASAFAVGLGVHLAAPECSVYRGISGVYYGVMTFALIAMIRRDGGRKAFLWGAILAALLFKTAYELATGTLLVQTCLPDGVAVVGMSHLTGIVAGALVAAWKSQEPTLPAAPPEGEGMKRPFTPPAPYPTARPPADR